MATAAGSRGLLAVRGLPFFAVPVRLRNYLLVVNLAVAGWSAFAIARMPGGGHAWLVALLLAVLAVAYEEGSRQAARLQMRLSLDLKRDMTSVWTVAAAVALPPGHAVVFLAAVLTYNWWRQQRPAGQPAYRGWFAASTQILGCLSAGVASRAVWHACAGLPWALGGTLAIVAAILVQTLVNRSLITVALLGVGATLRDVLGTSDENLIELATLCLGGLVAVAALSQPWLCLLVIPPLASLQRGALVRELERAATTDAKTGLLNAVAWEQVAKREILRAERQDTSLAVLIIDIDRFKLVNDRHGHLAGDAVLRGVGRCLQAEVREYDTVGRFGGEEFVAVLPSASEAEAMIVAERIRSRVRELRVSTLVDGAALDLASHDTEAGDDRMAVSIGVACLTDDGRELDELLQAADGALYRAKAAGRNRVLLARRGTGGTERVSIG